LGCEDGSRGREGRETIDGASVDLDGTIFSEGLEPQSSSPFEAKATSDRKTRLVIVEVLKGSVEAG
jgi:hypothetical protein